MFTPEQALDLYRRAEISKGKRGMPNVANKTPRLLAMMHKWSKVQLNTSQLANLQVWISPQKECGTYQIFQHTQNANALEVAKAIPKLRELQMTEVNRWLEPIGPELKNLMLRQQLEPLILVYPACFTYGNIFDGNHRTLSILANDDIDQKVGFSAIIGKIPWTLWCLSFIRSVIKANCLSQDEKSTLMRERFKNLNNPIS